MCSSHVYNFSLELSKKIQILHYMAHFEKQAQFISVSIKMKRAQVEKSLLGKLNLTFE